MNGSLAAVPHGTECTRYRDKVSEKSRVVIVGESGVCERCLYFVGNYADIKGSYVACKRNLYPKNKHTVVTKSSLPKTNTCTPMPPVKEPRETVHHPDHYNKGIEVIKFIESWDLNFSRGSAIKYICRGGLKDPGKEMEDLEKAKQYIEFEINRLGRLKSENNKSES